MSLTDLKNKAAANRKKKSPVSVDDFIEGAADYSKGHTERYRKGGQKKSRKYKNATFTLSPKQIEYLNELAQKTGLAKSKLLRLLIEDLANEKHIKIEQIQEQADKPAPETK